MTLKPESIQALRDATYAAKAKGRMVRARLPFHEKLVIADQLREAGKQLATLRARKSTRKLSSPKD